MLARREDLDLDIKNKEGKTALDVAIEKGHLTCKKILCSPFVGLKEVRWVPICSIVHNQVHREEIKLGFSTTNKTEVKGETETSRNVTWNTSAEAGLKFGFFNASAKGGRVKSDDVRNFSSRLNSFSNELSGMTMTEITYQPIDRDTTILQLVIVGWCKREKKEYLLKTKHVTRVNSDYLYKEDPIRLPLLSNIM
jgi:hypothetical protein